MPAPTPIQIRYGGDPSALGGLAHAAGSARRRSADYQAQLANDRAFLQNEISRRTEDTRYQNNFNLSLLGQQANERAARAQATALQEASGFRQRQAAQTGGVTPPSARGGSTVTLVPEEGPIDGTQGGGGGYVDFYDGPRDGDGPIRRVFSKDDKLIRFGGRVGEEGAELTPDERGGYVGAGQQQGIPADRRSALEYIKVLRGTIPEGQWNSMWVAVQQGALDPSDVPKLVDDIRSGLGGGKMTPGQGVARSAEGTAARMNAIEGISDTRVRESEMLRHLGLKVGTREYARLQKSGLDEAWYARWTGVEAALGAGAYNPPTSQGMLGSSSANPVDLSEPSDAKNLPSGTYFRTPDGRILRRN